jgi:NADH dehydrogenase FAD-containing subunit
MVSDEVKLISKVLGHFISLGPKIALQRANTIYHSWTWTDTPESRNVVVIGGSLAGFELVKRLAETLPTGYKLVWIEKNSHLNYSFTFPRFSVMTGSEHKAFIPYDGVMPNAPHGIYTKVQDTAVDVDHTHVLLASGDRVEYSYLAVATGSSQPLPVQVSATEVDMHAEN